VIRVSGLYIYPVKSCTGLAVEEAVVEATGFALDRRWMVVDADGGFLSQRRIPKLAVVRVSVGEACLSMSAPGLPELEVAFKEPPGPLRTVTVWRDSCAAVDEGTAAAQWLTRHLGCDARLVRLAGDDARPLLASSGSPGGMVSFADAFPFLLVSEASLDELNRRLAVPVPMDRFRPNIVVSGCGAHAEDGWRRVLIGDLPFRVAKPCARCVITTTDQKTGERGPEPLKTLSAYRKLDGKVVFGQNLVHEGTGTVQIGDELRAISGV